jgi:preprotein translocase subunit YajC
MYHAKLIGGQIFVVMAFISQCPQRKQDDNHEDRRNSLHKTPAEKRV